MRLASLVLAMVLGWQTAAAQTGQFPGVVSPVPAPRPALGLQPPIVYSPNLQGRAISPNVMAPVTPLPYAPTVVPGVPSRHVAHIGRHLGTPRLR